MKTRPQHTATYTHEDEATGENWDVEIAFAVDPGEPEVRNLPNGDPGHPGTPAGIDDVSYKVTAYTLFDDEGNPVSEFVRSTSPEPAFLDAKFAAMVEADDKLRERIESACWDSLDNDCDDGPDDADRNGY